MSLTTGTFYDAAAKIWHGPSRADLYEPQANVGGEILKSLKKYPNKIIQINDDDGSATTAANLLSASEAIATEFLSIGLAPGDIIGICAGNTSNLAAVIIAALFCGSPWHAIYPKFENDVIKQIYDLTTPKIICCDLECYETIRIAIEEMNSNAVIYIINGNIPEVKSIDALLQSSKNKIFNEESFPGLNLNDGDTTAVILCSSGTTGQPKGVCLSHRSLLNNIVFGDVTSESSLFSYSTLFWISGLWTLLTSILNGAQRIITNKSATPESFLNIIQKYQVTHAMSSTSPMAELAQECKVSIEQRFESVHSLLYGGSNVSLSTAEKLYEIFGNVTRNKPGPIVCYGMTELSGMLTQTDANRPGERRFDNEGKLLPNMQVKIKDRLHDEFLGPNNLGYIYVRIPYKWAGYYHNEEATKKVYEGDWFNTSDIGFFDHEGFLHVCGRESDIFKASGFHIYPNRLEEIILQLPGVAEVCVFGIPDPVAINLTACAIVRSKGNEGAMPTKMSVEDHVKQNASEVFHISGGVYFLKQLPKTASGKLLRRKVYDLIKEN